VTFLSPDKKVTRQPGRDPAGYTEPWATTRKALQQAANSRKEPKADNPQTSR